MIKTYFTSKTELKGTCYFEFQIGKYTTPWLEDSLYLHADVIAPFTRLITGTHPNKKRGFDFFGLTYLNSDDIKDMIKKLREFAILLTSKKNIFQALEMMERYDFTIDKWHESYTLKLKWDILKNTAEKLANWAEEILSKHKTITVCGI
ncbi:MAG: hypothetical protein FWE13_03045 [Firmicutes bacterium]|nr:hypothetical protein [Bacillota bacterium]